MAAATQIYSEHAARRTLEDIRENFGACDVSRLIVQMNYFLELFGQTLADIGTTEEEVEMMRREGHRRGAMAAWHAACHSHGARARANIDLMDSQLEAAALNYGDIGVAAKAAQRLKDAVARKKRAPRPRKARAA